MAETKQEKPKELMPNDGLPMLTKEQREKLDELWQQGENFVIKAELTPFTERAKEGKSK